MESVIVMIVFGVIISVIGFINMKGNIKTIHWYHRTRIKKEDTKKYGILVGIATLIIGLSLIATGVLQICFNLESFDYLIIIGLIVGLILFIYAQFKYNKGIF